jgi:hypothetical protein
VGLGVEPGPGGDGTGVGVEPGPGGDGTGVGLEPGPGGDGTGVGVESCARDDEARDPVASSLAET